MKHILILLFIAGSPSIAHASQLSGKVTDEQGKQIENATVALLHPEDSTMETFSISQSNGQYLIKDAPEGDFLLQISLVGYYTCYQKLHIGKEANQSVPDVALEDNIAAHQLGEVVIAGDKIPVRLKGDTVEYNAGSYRVKPNAPVEELLRQLPGVEVDEAGNIKSMGKDVNKVLVDGKEFFGNDPKVATKNLPADAVSHVQTFGKKSDQTEFTGVDDGKRDQTINLVLKDGKHGGYFGNVEAGVGSNQRYEGAARLFRFQPKEQLAGIGMLNNINQTGFSFNDYLSFNGGLSALGGGGRMDMSSDDIPMDFGQQPSGNVSSGAIGLNYTYEPRPKNRLNISYLSNTTTKDVTNNTFSRNYLPSGATYTTNEYDQRNNNDLANRLSMRWRNDLDSQNQITVQAKGQVKNKNATSDASARSYSDAALQNQLQDHSSGVGNVMDVTTEASYVHKARRMGNLFQIYGSQGYSGAIDHAEWTNVTEFLNTPGSIVNQQYQQNHNTKEVSTFDVNTTRALGGLLFLRPGVNFVYRKEQLNRSQGLLSDQNNEIDSLSPHFRNDVYQVTPGMSLKYSSSKLQWNVNVQGQWVSMNPATRSMSIGARDYRYLLPSFYWRKEFPGHHNVSAEYSTQVNTPAPNQMIPVTYYTSPLSAITGNLNLKPEYRHNLMLSYQMFDQFSMSSLFAYVNASYTQDKINTSRTILPDLRQRILWVNTPYMADLNGRLSYSRPVKPLRITYSIEAGETISRSVSPINDVQNTNTNFTHELSMSISNRHRKAWTVRLGGNARITDSRYSVNTNQNAIYGVYSGSGTISWQSGKHWFAQVSADITRYTGSGFSDQITVPLVKAELTRFLLKNERASITLRGFDLLNRNQSVVRAAEQNYLVEQRSNILSRYFMIVLNYKLNKVGKHNPGGIEIN
ncbi:MAG: outer membrane beta-barrel protein [Chitinophagaceae bacterium]